MNMYMYLATFVCVGKKRLEDFYSGFSNVRRHKPVSHVCLKLNMGIQMLSLQDDDFRSLFRLIYKCDLYLYLYLLVSFS